MLPWDKVLPVKRSQGNAQVYTLANEKQEEDIRTIAIGNEPLTLR
jgi:hypothetical protein